jgi:hypothetical protein
MSLLDGSPTFDLSTLTATGVLGWYAWHTTYHTIPNLVAAFRDELTAIRCECAEERTALHAELAAERKQRYAHHVLVVEALHDLARRLPSQTSAT